MSPTTKRWIISTAETFGAAFFITVITMISPVINSGQFPTKQIIISTVFAGFIAGAKSIAKIIREKLTGTKEDILSK